MELLEQHLMRRCWTRYLTVYCTRCGRELAREWLDAEIRHEEPYW